MIELDFPKEVKAVKFGSWTLNPRRHILSDDKIEVELELLLYKILAFLILNRDRIVTRDELISEVWQQKYVDDNAINRAFSELRKALKSDQQRGLVIKTHYRKGYSFILEVDIVKHDEIKVNEPTLPAINDSEVSHTNNYSLIEKKQKGSYTKLVALGATLLILIIIIYSLLLSTSTSQKTLETPYEVSPLTWGEGSAKNVVVGNEKLIAYEYKRFNTFFSELRIIDIEAKTTVIISEANSNLIPLTWSEDGAELYYQLKDKNRCEIWSAELTHIKERMKHKKLLECESSISFSATVIDDSFVYTKFGYRGKSLVASLYNFNIKTGEEFRITNPSINSFVGDFFVTRLIVQGDKRIVFIRKESNEYKVFTSSVDGSESVKIYSSDKFISYIQQVDDTAKLQWTEKGTQYYFDIETTQKKATTLSKSNTFNTVYEVGGKKITYKIEMDLDIVAVNIESEVIQPSYASDNSEKIQTPSYNGREILITNSDKDYVWLVSDERIALIATYTPYSIQDASLSHDGKKVMITIKSGFEIINVDSLEVIFSQLDYENILSGLWFDDDEVFLLQGAKGDVDKNFIRVNLNSKARTILVINAGYKLYSHEDENIYFKSKENTFYRLNTDSNKVSEVYKLDPQIIIVDWLVRDNDLFYADLNGLMSINLHSNKLKNYKSLTGHIIVRLASIEDEYLNVTIASDKKSDLVLLERKIASDHGGD